MSRFQTTRWSVVLQAREDSARARDALEQLCRTYRTPVVAYVRGRGFSAADSEDLSQSFFTALIGQALHAHADPARGRFRSFLLTALKNFLANSLEHDRAQKRGGRVLVTSLDDADDGEAADIADSETPEQAFERAWAQAALRAAMRRLQAEAAAAGRGALFDRLCEFLIEPPDDAEYVRVAADFNIRRNTIAVSVHRLRQRLRELLREELADTVAGEDDLRQERDDLQKSMALLQP
jgi:RNA polymerase sigma-70 factor (ECF subfamily)